MEEITIARSVENEMMSRLTGPENKKAPISIGANTVSDNLNNRLY